ncbi:NLP/P60 protein [Caldalkalibacillus thermarum TA2.A1]|uniref:C40 family peptidase n=1 Tax=Caldalkalibacillus thermarum (strain TA2.A1) TaxID=986075 RepID=F5L7Y6_CALTT|nr:C40 family peptidase [Caldalkalibacillus thermarum]EGL82574.1 NLP/P60 protein [Caldalkalibacillus thermarum TA2.A1]QZT34777.1 C40 family peptidase [Caldalkalibacillus thermarum TA2.A1]
MINVRRPTFFWSFVVLLAVSLIVNVPTGEAQSVGDAMAREAKTLIGTPYQFGGTNPSQGFDASGLIYYLHQQQGITIPRTVKDQARGGQTISVSNLQPGDVLIFKDSRGNPSISALYMGNMQAIASLPSTNGVRLHSVNTKWAREHFLVAKRYINNPAVQDQSPSREVPAAHDKASNLADNIIRTAEKYLGTPYRYGAKPGSGYFDCSLFTQTVFAENGIQLPRSSRQQSQVGTYVRWGEWEKGDLLFFWTRSTGEGNVGHVAIYAGDGKIIHTWGSPGVTYDRITDRTWRETYMGAKRVIR